MQDFHYSWKMTVHVLNFRTFQKSWKIIIHQVYGGHIKLKKEIYLWKLA